MKLIPLSKGYVAVVDDDDHEALASHRWYVLVNKSGQAYAARKIRNRSERVLLLMHRVILSAPPGVLVDHRNRDTLDNRRANLRLATRSQNAVNRRDLDGRAAPFRGVYLHKGRWRVLVRYEGKQYDMGRFDCPLQAACAYDAKARELHGEFAVLNFPTERSAGRPPSSLDEVRSRPRGIPLDQVNAAARRVV